MSSRIAAVNPIEAPFLSRAPVPLGFTQMRHERADASPNHLLSKDFSRLFGLRNVQPQGDKLCGNPGRDPF
jgi:hypothetical protein